MSKKISILIISIIIVASLAISIFVPNKDKIKETEDTSINYSITEKNGKYGVSQNGNIIIEPQYDEIIIPNVHRAVFMCKNGEENKFINDKEEEIFQDYNNVQLIEYEDSNFEKDILIYEDKGKYGLLGISGNAVTQAKYEEIFSFGYKRGELLIKEDGKYGIIDESGKIKIKNKYDSIQLDGYYTDENQYNKSGYIVCVTTNEGYRYGYYDSDAIQVLDEEYNQITRLTQIKSNDIYLIVAKNGQYGVFINNTKIVNTQYQSIDYNPDLQIFITERTGKYGAINLNGAEILKPEYSQLQVKGIYIYTVKDEENKVFDINGKEVNIPFNTIITNTSNSNYLIKNEDGKYSIVNSKFENILENTFSFIEYAYNDYFIVANEQDNVGVIDTEGNIVVDFKYDLIQLVKGKSIIQAIEFDNNKTDFYDSQFDLTLEISNANIETTDDGVRIYNNEIEHFLDNNGKSIK